MAAHPKTLRIAVALALVPVLVVGALWWTMIRMPGESHAGPLPALSPGESTLAGELRRDVTRLAGMSRTVGRADELAGAARWVEGELAATGLSMSRHRFSVGGAEFSNVVGTLHGARSEVVLVGAHYDVVRDCPGANDNASGVAALLALARQLAGTSRERTVRFVAFANEEPPLFQGDGMGSLEYARMAAERGDRIVAMMSLETMGYYADAEGSQQYPAPFSWFYPSRGDFIAFVGHAGSKDLLERAVGSFREAATIPSEGAAPPTFVQGAGWSDHWSFWQAGYPAAIMVTDTAPFRYGHYHQPTDTPDKLDYERFARVVAGLVPVVVDLADR